MSFKLKLDYKPGKLVFPCNCAFLVNKEKVHLKRNDTIISFKVTDWKEVFSVSPTANNSMKKPNCIRNKHKSKYIRMLKNRTILPADLKVNSF